MATYQPADLRMVLRPARGDAPWLELLFADATAWLADVDAADWLPRRSGHTGEEWHFGSGENTVWSGASRFRLLDPREAGDGPLYVPAAMLDFGVPPFAPGEQPAPPAAPPIPPPEDLAADAFVREALFVSRRLAPAGAHERRRGARPAGHGPVRRRAARGPSSRPLGSSLGWQPAQPAARRGR